MDIGYSLLRDTMDSLEINPTKDNAHFELLRDADTMLLQEHFGPIVSEHARTFGSLKELNSTSEKATVEPLKYKITVLSQDFIDVLKQVYSKLFPKHATLIADTVTFPNSARKFQYIHWNGNKLSSVSEGLHARAPYILAKPLFDFSSATGNCVRPAQIQYFIKHSINISTLSAESGNEINLSCILAVVEWPHIHPSRDVMGKPVEIWCDGLFETVISNVFLPIDNFNK